MLLVYFADRGSGDADDALVNGESPDSPAKTRNNIITITGKAEDCERAKKALLVSSVSYYFLV